MKLTAYVNLLNRLRGVESRMTREFERATGFSLTRYQILVFLRDHDGCLQVDIADFLQIDPGAVTRHLKILESKGYVRRIRNCENGREVIVSLTDFARGVLAECRARHGGEACDPVIPFSMDEIGALTGILDRIERKFEEGSGYEG